MYLSEVYLQYIGTGWCQDFLNNAGCGFDGGDCCGPGLNTAQHVNAWEKI